MKRRDFIVKSGLVITATAISSNSFAIPFSKSDSSNASEEEIKRDDYKKFSQPIMQVIAIALNTPSAHNTQPFKFKIIGDNNAEFYLDEAQYLSETDPPMRQLHISCGCFLELVSIGSTLIGHKADINFFPQGEYTTKDFGKKPIATIKLNKEETTVHPLALQIFKRNTSRFQFSGNMITNEVYEKMKTEANPLFSKMIFQNDKEKLAPYLNLFKEAMKIESNTISTNEETRRMWRFADEEAATLRNGLTWEAQGMKGMSKFFAKKFVKNTKESWNNQANIDKGLASFSDKVDSSKGIVFWTSETNTVQDWVNVGRDIMVFWLILTKNNLYCHPLNQAIQEFKEMDDLRTKLDSWLRIKNKQKIQMIMRIGKSDEPFVSFRKHVENFIK